MGQVANAVLAREEESPMTGSTRKGWTLAIVSIGLFMVVLDAS